MQMSNCPDGGDGASALAAVAPQALGNNLRHKLTAALMLTVALSLGACTTVTVGGSPPPEPAEASKRAQARVDLAGNYFARGQSDVALEEVKLAIDADPNYAAAYNLRGLIYGSLGDVRLAEESFDRAARLDPRDGNILHNHAWFLCQQGRYTDAHARFEAALKLPTYRDPVRTLLTQGVCYARERRLDMAEATLTRAYEIDAGNPAVGYNLADVLHRRGDYERARFFIRRVNQQEGALNAQTLWLAARIEHRLGNRSGAATFGNQLRSQFPQSPEALAYERGRLDD